MGRHYDLPVLMRRGQFQPVHRSAFLRWGEAAPEPFVIVPSRITGDSASETQPNAWLGRSLAPPISAPSGNGFKGESGQDRGSGLGMASRRGRRPTLHEPDFDGCNSIGPPSFHRCAIDDASLATAIPIPNVEFVSKTRVSNRRSIAPSGNRPDLARRGNANDRA